MQVYVHVFNKCMCTQVVDVSIRTCECVWKCMCMQVRVYGDVCACACAGVYVHMSAYGCVCGSEWVYGCVGV